MESKTDELSSLRLTLLDWLNCADISNKSTLEKSLVYPILDTLRFFHDESEGIAKLYVEPQKDKLVGLCVVIGKDASLDSTIKGKHYSQILVSALEDNKLSWGILTNGGCWRLYHSEGSTPFESYFEVYLERILQEDEIDAVYLFQRFFHVKAFIPGENGCLLDRYLEESEETTKKIEAHLANKIEDVLSRICLGFIEAEGMDSYSEEEKTIIFDNSIYLLYRLLFILYAESRGLLPLDKSGYKETSLNALTELSRQYHLGKKGDRENRQIWNMLHEVFNWINEGNTQLDIPPYNGGLFDDKEKPYLENHYLNDAYMSEVLYNLSYTDKDEKINYNDLSVRHLGSLYEGILEYRLFIAAEDMVRRKIDKNTYIFIPISQVGKLKKEEEGNIFRKGSIYFAASMGERKITGSYYTPEPIVENIVKNTVEHSLSDTSKEFKEHIKSESENIKIAVNEEEKRRIQEFIDKEIVEFIERKILCKTILDPTMGSGHFLVNATCHLTNYIVELLNITPWENTSVDTDPVIWRRKVVERCMYGVDLNPLATELAKLSLWLISASNDKPLSFLDHHIRCGNSLIGARLEDLGVLPKNDNKRKNSGQKSIFQVRFERELKPKLMKAFKAIEELPSDELIDIEKKRKSLKSGGNSMQVFNISRISGWLRSLVLIWMRLHTLIYSRKC